MLWGLLPTHILVSIWCLLYFRLNKLQFWSLELQTMNTSRRCFLELREVDSGVCHPTPWLVLKAAVLRQVLPNIFDGCRSQVSGTT